jgi:hypothetical protein
MKLKLVKLVILIVAAIGIARFCHHQTAGFKLSKIRDNFCEQKEWVNSPLDAETRALLQEKFTYFGRGLQSFAFLSPDQKYVLKIFNNHYQRKAFWLQFLPGCSEKQQIQEQKLEKAFASYQIAYEELKDETGLVYMHLNPTEEFHHSAIVVDKLGIEHPIDLNHTAFLVQKKVDLVYAKLSFWKERGETHLAKQGISSLLHLIKNRFERGIADHDPLIRTNFGFIGEEALQIDVGAFVKGEPMDNPEKEFARILASLKDWVQKNYPELSEHLDEEMR